MSLMPYASPLQIELGRSRGLLIYSLGLHLLVGAILMLSVPLLWGLHIIPILGISAWWLIRKQVLRTHPESIIHINWDSEQDWWLSNREGKQSGPWQLAGESFVTTWLVILSLKPETGRNVFVLIPADSANSERMRKLRVRLKIDRP